MQSTVLEIEKLLIEVPANRGSNDFKRELLRKAIIKTENKVAVYIIGVSRLMESSK